jgi:glyoxylase-like metal-dependent hydrolase (beta-lactamase superfamily II)/ferredoxin
MANVHKRVAENVPGDFYVDTTCIDCDVCRQIAPASFREGRTTSFVYSQPTTPEHRRSALRALVSCPTGSIGCLGSDDPKSVFADFPLLIDGPVYFCGFTSPRSFGGNSYFYRHPAGNWLVDAPKFLPHLVRQFETLGGLSRIFLTHRDDVADADRYARHFGAERIIDARELDAQPDAERVLTGDAPTDLGDGFVAIPTPGHTAGHLCLLATDRYLFTGDHLYWDREAQSLAGFRDYCDSWPTLIDSMKRLAAYPFEWVIPGHGQRIHLPSEEMRRQVEALVAANSA